MATKKQKRLLGAARAAKELEESKKRGLLAQKRDHERKAMVKKKTHETHIANDEVAKNCDLCVQTG